MRPASLPYFSARLFFWQHEVWLLRLFFSRVIFAFSGADWHSFFFLAFPVWRPSIYTAWFLSFFLSLLIFQHSVVLLLLNELLFHFLCAPCALLLLNIADAIATAIDWRRYCISHGYFDVMCPRYTIFTPWRFRAFPRLPGFTRISLFYRRQYLLRDASALPHFWLFLASAPLLHRMPSAAYVRHYAHFISQQLYSPGPGRKSQAISRLSCHAWPASADARSGSFFAFFSRFRHGWRDFRLLFHFDCLNTTLAPICTYCYAMQQDARHDRFLMNAFWLFMGVCREGFDILHAM